jgi:intraflagellar transport protein 122
VSDFALWTPDVSNIDKIKYKEKILCSAWSADGQTCSFGTIGGVISLRNRKL